MPVSTGRVPRAPRLSSPGHYPFSNFYPGTGTFHLLNTCNTWTARGLAAAGLQVRVSGVLQAEALMGQLLALARAGMAPAAE